MERSYLLEMKCNLVQRVCTNCPITSKYLQRSVIYSNVRKVWIIVEYTKFGFYWSSKSSELLFSGKDFLVGQQALAVCIYLANFLKTSKICPLLPWSWRKRFNFCRDAVLFVSNGAVQEGFLGSRSCICEKRWVQDNYLWILIIFCYSFSEIYFDDS